MCGEGELIQASLEGIKHYLKIVWSVFRGCDNTINVTVC